MMFADAIREKLESDSELKKKHRRIYKILTGPDSPQRRRWLEVAEHAVRKQQNIPEGVAIDWSSIDWVMVFKVLVGLLSIFLLFL